MRVHERMDIDLQNKLVLDLEEIKEYLDIYKNMNDIEEFDENGDLRILEKFLKKIGIA